MSACMDYEIENEFEIENNQLISNKELETIISTYIFNYFKDKQIDESIDLYSSRYIDMCAKTNVCQAVDKAYEILEKTQMFETSADNGFISEDIKFVIKTLNKIRKIVPHEFCAGIFLMHLELVEKIKI